MNIEILLLVACIPIIIMCTYIYNKDRDKEPSKTLEKLFLYGVLSIIPIVILELIASKIVILDKNNIVVLFINVFVTVGLIEEGAKWVIVNKSVYNDIEFNHAYDAIIYCVFASLGFALVENLIYVFDSGLLVGVLRGLTTIPSHTFNGIIMGYFLGKSKQEEYNKNINGSRKYMFLSLLMPILCHTLYDFLIFRENTQASILFLILVVIIYIISFILVKKVSIINRNFDGSRYDSKERKSIVSDSDLFIDSLFKVLIVTLGLIVFSVIYLLLLRVV